MTTLIPPQEEDGRGFRNVNTSPRLVVVETVYHQPVEGDTAAESSGFSKELVSDEECYTRTMKLTTSWVRLDAGWLTESSQVMLKNLSEPSGFTNIGGFVFKESETHNPQAEEDPFPEKAAVEASQHQHGIVEVGFSKGEAPDEPHLLLTGGESCRFRAKDLSYVWVRASMPKTKCLVFVVPT